MGVRTLKNQYRGINAHLHSYWQAAGGWSSFHTNHITDLMRTLRPPLLAMNYDVDVEPSLQIRRIDDSEPPQYPQSDVTIYDLDPARPPPQGKLPLPASAAEVVLALPEALFGEPRAEREFSAVKIYRLGPGKLERGEPVAWLELLSPSNKPGGRDAQEYFDKRLAVLENGIVFVEIDYLHESAPTLKGIPSYRARRGRLADENARAYRIIVIDPRPKMQEGVVRLSEFDVDAPIPTVVIPLNEGDTLALDFGIPYRKTFEETLYGLQLVDYSQLPLNFERYSPADQARIVARMVAVLEAERAGVNLDEAAPLPVDTITLEDGLARLAQIAGR